jgi:hypothetical protein
MEPIVGVACQEILFLKALCRRALSYVSYAYGYVLSRLRLPDTTELSATPAGFTATQGCSLCCARPVDA